MLQAHSGSAPPLFSLLPSQGIWRITSRVLAVNTLGTMTSIKVRTLTGLTSVFLSLTLTVFTETIHRRCSTTPVFGSDILPSSGVTSIPAFTPMVLKFVDQGSVLACLCCGTPFRLSEAAYKFPEGPTMWQNHVTSNCIGHLFLTLTERIL